MVDDLKRAPDDNPTVGIILCTHKDASVVRYSVLHENEHLFASKFKLVLPSEEELRAELTGNVPHWKSNANISLPKPENSRRHRVAYAPPHLPFLARRDGSADESGRVRTKWTSFPLRFGTLRSICAHDPAHCSNTLGAEAKNLPHLFGGGYRIANDVGTHRSGVNALVRRRRTV